MRWIANWWISVEEAFEISVPRNPIFMTIQSQKRSFWCFPLPLVLCYFTTNRRNWGASKWQFQEENCQCITQQLYNTIQSQQCKILSLHDEEKSDPYNKRTDDASCALFFLFKKCCYCCCSQFHLGTQARHI